MIDNKKIVCFTPAGRRRYMRLLLPYILASDAVDRYDIWLNTIDKKDLLFFEYIATHFKKVRLVQQPDGIVKGNASICAFFKNNTEDNTIYIRLDDDVVWTQKDFFKKLASHVIAKPDAFVVSPLVLNNAICSHLLQQYKKITLQPAMQITAYAFDGIGWQNGKFAAQLHRWFIGKIHAGKDADVLIEGAPLPIALNRFSINCIAFTGETFKSFGGTVLGDEEEYLTVTKPTELGLINYIAGDCLVSHFAFGPQRKFLDTTDVLAMYEDVLKERAKEDRAIQEAWSIISKFDENSVTEETVVKSKKPFKTRLSTALPFVYLYWLKIKMKRDISNITIE